MKIGVFGDPNNLSTQYRANTYQDFIICLEMTIAAIAYSFTFSYSDFVDGTKSKKPILNNLKIVNFFVIKMCNFVCFEVLNVKDVISEAKNAFVDEEEIYETPMRVVK